MKIVVDTIPPGMLLAFSGYDEELERAQHMQVDARFAPLVDKAMADGNLLAAGGLLAEWAATKESIGRTHFVLTGITE